MVTYSSQTLSVCTVSGNVVTTLAAGTCKSVASQAGAVGYILAASQSQSFTVNALSQTISFGTLADHEFGSGPFTISATASSWFAGDVYIIDGERVHGRGQYCHGGRGGNVFDCR
jgi:hypothetical protein